MYEMATRQIPFFSFIGSDIRSKIMKGERPVAPEGK